MKLEIKEAINILKYYRPIGAINAGFPKEPSEDVKAYNLAIEALEKQIPKKPIENFYDERDGEDWYDEGYTYSCPSCEDDREIGRYSKESEEWIFEIDKYCPCCGQKIDCD